MAFSGHYQKGQLTSSTGLFMKLSLIYAPRQMDIMQLSTVHYCMLQCDVDQQSKANGSFI